MNNIIKAIVIVIFIVHPAYAIRESRPTPIDSRIRVMVYSPNDVFKFTGYYNYQSYIELAKDETVVSISMGDTTAWQIVPAGHRIFIKPVEEEATTNMTLITNKRTYFFELYAQETQNIRDPGMVFSVKFLYPESEDDSSGDGMHNSVLSDTSVGSIVPDLAHPERLNFNYTISGNEEIAPIKIFDDGEFTYLQFRDKNNEMPAVFAVDEDLRESIVNIKLDQNNSNLLIIEQVFPKLALRNGKKVVCIFNEAFRPY